MLNQMFLELKRCPVYWVARYVISLIAFFGALIFANWMNKEPLNYGFYILVPIGVLLCTGSLLISLKNAARHK